MENHEYDGFRIKRILALNHHWYDALLDYSPTKLTIDNKQLSPENGLIQSLKQQSLKDLQHLKIDGRLASTVFNCKNFDELLKLLHEKDFSLSSLIMHGLGDCEWGFYEPDLDFFEKHCSNLRVLELKDCCTSYLDWCTEPFDQLVTRNVI